MMAPRTAEQNATPPDWFYERTDAPEHWHPHMVADIGGVLEHTEVSAGRSAASPSRGRLTSCRGALPAERSTKVELQTRVATDHVSRTRCWLPFGAPRR